MIDNNIFWYFFGLSFLYSIYDVKKQRTELKKLKSKNQDYALQSKIYTSEISIIICGILILLNELFLLIGW
jgi:hypothetical protein